ncbi:hypothetical protein KY358_07090 [Candidatus Woesearchaeota archaeon]|nr:hypothetical protein [Candidatus Woesearchaeota archaeon]
MFTEDEKKVLKQLVKKELDSFKKQEDKITLKSISDVRSEFKYGSFLKGLLKKLR